jgi:two-component system CheB/CheR fusion protein
LYRQTTVKRRVLRRQALHSLETPQVYVEYLRENPAQVHALYEDLLLKVTQFFRDPEAFDALNRLVFPQLVQNRSAKAPIRLWVSMAKLKIRPQMWKNKDLPSTQKKL